MALIVDENELRAAGLTDAEARVEFAVLLYSQGRISEGKAAEMAGISRHKLYKELAQRKIPRNYTADDLREEMQQTG